MHIVLDLEFYHNKKREVLGPIKQLGAFKFDDNYHVVDIFEMTVTQYTTQEMLKYLFANFVSDVDTIYLWAKNNDTRALKAIVEIDQFNVVDVQEYFKEVNLASLSTISEALLFEPEGRHNALVDAEYTLEVIKYFDFNSEVSRKAIKNYIKLIRSNDQLQKKQSTDDSKPVASKEQQQPVTNNGAKLIIPGTMRKLNDEYYQVVNERAIKTIISDIEERKLSITKDGNFTLNDELEALVKERSNIVFSNTPKFKSIAKKHEDKLIVIVDNSKPNNYLAVFVSKKAYKKFIK